MKTMLFLLSYMALSACGQSGTNSVHPNQSANAAKMAAVQAQCVNQGTNAVKLPGATTYSDQLVFKCERFSPSCFVYIQDSQGEANLQIVDTCPNGGVH